MKKIKSLFLALLAMMLAVPSLHAQATTSSAHPLRSRMSSTAWR